jgi:acetyl-CoA carboxylase biotin carboxyl carrier protein
MTQQGGSFDKDLIRELAALLEETGLTEIEVEHEGKRIRVARGVNLTTTLTTDVPQSEPRENTRTATRTEEFIVHRHGDPPMVGTAHRSLSRARRRSSRSARVTAGVTLLIIEAAKTMNRPPSAGTVIATLRTAAGRHGEPLAVIEHR